MGWASRLNLNLKTRENLKKRRMEDREIVQIPLCSVCGEEAIQQTGSSPVTFTVAAETIDGRKICDECAGRAR